MSELKPCPFCGTPSNTVAAINGAPIPLQAVICRECAAMCPRQTEADAIAAWNLRTEPAGSEPVAWMYSHPDGSRYVSTQRWVKPYHDMRPERREGWTEKPLYRAPPREVDVSQTPVDDHQDGLVEQIEREIARTKSWTPHLHLTLTEAKARIQSDAVELARVEREVVALAREAADLAFQSIQRMRAAHVACLDLTNQAEALLRNLGKLEPKP